MTAVRFPRLAAARLYLVCPDLPEERLDAALRGGVQLVQLRMKGAEDAAVLQVARRFRAVCDRHGVPLILNDRPDLVKRARADGVHLGQDDVSIAEARGLLGAEHIIGLSTHSPAQIDAAAGAGVDYIGVGPVHATPTKPGRPAVGERLVSYAADHAALPWFAIGGIDAANLGPILAAGADRVAVVRAIAEAPDPETEARRLRASLGVEERIGAA